MKNMSNDIPSKYHATDSVIYITNSLTSPIVRYIIGKAVLRDKPESF